MTYESTRDWAVGEFGTAAVGDIRWRSRLMQMAERAARQPNGRVTEVFANAAERQGAYGLLENDKITGKDLGAAMVAATARRCAAEQVVFVAVDGSSLTLTDRKKCKDFGFIGPREDNARGLKMMNALAVSLDGVPLGLTAQIWWTRTGEAVKCRHAERPASEKETRHWLSAMEQTRQLMHAHAPQTRCWFQLDREGDAWPILIQADEDSHWFTVRGSHDRRVRLAGGAKSYLRTVLREQAVTCHYNLPVSAGPGRRARTAVMAVRTATVTLDLRDKPSSRRFAKSVNVILTRELSSTPDQKPIEWMLLTNRPVETTEDIAQIIYGYSQRWRIEDFHRTWKSGACNVERMQLRSVSAVMKWATLLASVATRIERLKVLSRTQPQRPALSEFSPLELRAIVLVRFGKKRPPPGGDTPSLKQVTQWLAEIGGYTGKSSGGPPGSTVLARGMAQMQIVANALEALEQDQ